MSKNSYLGKAVKSYMVKHVEDHLGSGGEVNCVALAGAASVALSLHEDDIEFVIYKWVLDVAADVRAWYSKRH
jgi:hypothetical protein